MKSLIQNDCAVYVSTYGTFSEWQDYVTGKLDSAPQSGGKLVYNTIEFLGIDR